MKTKGKDIALATLMRQDVREPCVNYCWMTNASYLTRVVGRDYWSDREGVFFEYLRRRGIHLVPQWYFPGDQQRNIELGHMAHEHLPGGHDRISGPQDILRAIDALPPDSELEANFNHDQAARNYADKLKARIARAGDEVLFLGAFGQANFMGGYTRWGYENYLIAIVDYPDVMRRYFHHTAVGARLLNEAIVLACQRHGIAPFVYSGQDICGSRGPMVAPRILREIYFPALKMSMEPLVRNGIGVIWHCDGNITPILEDLLDLGIMGMQGFEEEHGADYARIATLNGRDGRPLSVWGCVSVTSTLPHGTTADVRAAVERSFRLAGPGRGFVLSSTSSVMPEVPHENIDAMFHHAHAFGREFLGG